MRSESTNARQAEEGHGASRPQRAGADMHGPFPSLDKNVSKYTMYCTVHTGMSLGYDCHYQYYSVSGGYQATIFACVEKQLERNKRIRIVSSYQQFI